MGLLGDKQRSESMLAHWTLLGGREGEERGRERESVCVCVIERGSGRLQESTGRKHHISVHIVGHGNSRKYGIQPTSIFP